MTFRCTTCGKPSDDNVHATGGTCFARPEVCKRVHKHHVPVPPKEVGK